MTHKDNLRTSSYINVVDVGDGSSLLYNGFTSRIDLVPSEIARQLTSGNGRRDFSFLSPDEARYLVNRGHLTRLAVRRERAEFRKLAEHVLEANERSSKRVNGRKAITFILTYKCNLSCDYCYQNELRKKVNVPAMDAAFVDEFFRLYLNKLFPRHHRKNISLLLFGGEPLLPGNRGAIERILRYAKKYGSGVSVATNAVMVPAMLDLIGPKEGKINSVQVTLDGEKMFHDTTRVSQSGTPTFEDMIHSLRALIRAKAHTTIRIHLHPNGLASTRSLVEYLDREGILSHEFIKAYFAPISSFDGRDVSLTYFEPFSELFHHVAFRQNSPPSMFASSLDGMMDATATRTMLKSRYCTAGADALYVVDPCGDVYDCYEEAGNKARRIAVLAGGAVKYFRTRDTYKRRRILNMPECLKCSIALYCGGGCPNQARLQNGSVFTPFCEKNKEFVGQTLKAYFLLKKAGKARAAGEPIF